MFDDFNIWLFLILLLTFLVSSFLTSYGLKKGITKNREYIVKGYSKKRRRIMKVESEEISQAYWKVQSWEALGLTYALISAFLPPFMLLIDAPFFPETLMLAGSLIIFAIFSVIMRSRALRAFNKLADEVGARFEHDPEKIKEISDEFAKNYGSIKILGVDFIFFHFLTVVFLAIFAVADFLRGNIALAAIYAIIAIINMPALIKNVKIRAARKRQERADKH